MKAKKNKICPLMGAFLLFGDAFFVILCYNRGKNSSFLAPFPLFRTVAAVRNSYATCRAKSKRF